jgi:DNA-binding MarR family transcriptional regulator
VADDSETERTPDVHQSVGAWAKRYYNANRAAIDSVLRPYDVGTTQWYVLYQLATEGETLQRDLGPLLHLERATLSGIVAALVRKGWVDQSADTIDQRQRMLRLTDAGRELWGRLPDPVAVIRAHSFQGSTPEEQATAIRVLESATKTLNEWMSAGASAGEKPDQK